jgi:3,4-dihydroxy 2-butanone 4-phosphate synthase / GTP cyclohydrolase II
MKILTVAELIRYRMQHERYVRRIGEGVLPTRYGEFRLVAFESEVGGGESHLALLFGDAGESSDPVLVRVHSHCLVGDVFGTTLCECNAVLDRSMQMIAEAGRGAVIYLHQTAKGFNVSEVAGGTALSFAHERRDPTNPEHQRRTQRQIGLGAQILSDLNLRRIRLLTNHPRRVPALEGFGIEIVEQVPVSTVAVGTSS